MIVITATGPIPEREEYSEDREDGRDRIAGEATLSGHVEATLRLPDGHVNIEGYAPSSVGNRGRRDGRAEAVSMILNHCGFDAPVSGISDTADDWEVSIEGSPTDWVWQAVRYNTERPDQSLCSHLREWHEWDETNTEAIEEALDAAPFNGTKYDSL